MKGRKPIPTRLKILNGNPGKRHLNLSEPEAGRLSTPPKHLNKDAKAEWRRLVKVIHEKIVTSADWASFAGYCDSYADWKAACKDVDDRGQLITGRMGDLILNPSMRIKRDARAAMLRFAEAFGLTPSSRTRLSIPGGTLDELDAFCQTG